MRTPPQPPVFEYVRQTHMAESCCEPGPLERGRTAVLAGRHAGLGRPVVPRRRSGCRTRFYRRRSDFERGVGTVETRWRRREDLSHEDWRRVLLAAEVVFRERQRRPALASTGSITSGIPDEDAIAILRGLQRRLPRWRGSIRFPGRGRRSPPDGSREAEPLALAEGVPRMVDSRRCHAVCAAGGGPHRAARHAPSCVTRAGGVLRKLTAHVRVAAALPRGTVRGATGGSVPVRAGAVPPERARP